MGIGGVETVFINFLRALTEYTDAEIYVFTNSKITEGIHKQFFDNNHNVHLEIYYPLAEYFENLAKYCKIFPLKEIRKLLFHVYKTYKNQMFARKIQKMNFDAVVDHVTCSLYKQFRLIKHIPKITFLRGCFSVLPYSRTKHFPLYDRIIVLTNKALSEAQQKYPQYSERFARIYNIVDIKRVQKISKLKIPDFGKYFVSVSRLDVDKDIATIIKAFDLFYKTNKKPDCKLLIIGNGDNKNNLEQFSKQFESNKNILFLGKIPEPYQYMHNSLAHILSSRSEAFANTLVETAASGALNIASDCPDGPREILMNGKNGLLFTPGDEKQLAQIMSDVYNGRIDTKNMIQNMTKSLNRFEPKTIAEQFVNLIKNITKE